MSIIQPIKSTEVLGRKSACDATVFSQTIYKQPIRVCEQSSQSNSGAGSTNHSLVSPRQLNRHE